MTRTIAFVGLCFHLFVLRRGSYDQDLANSISHVASRVEGRWIYVSMMCGDVVEAAIVCGRRKRIFWLTFKETNGRLHNVKGNFCSIWQVSCAPMSRSTRVSARNFRNEDVAGSAMGEARTILRSMWWKL